MPNRDQSKEGKTYRFISDPRHKETLSGRVRAACVTCRRKKIKCDGEVPCNTCNERGLLCEGLTERKRPKSKPDTRRLSDVSSQLTADSPVSTLPSPTAEALQTAPLDGLFASAELASETLERPPLRKTDTADSGYSSGKRSTSPKLHPFDQIDSRIATYDFPNDIACGDLGPPDWAFYASQATLNHTQRNAIEPGSSAVDGLTGKLGGWSNTGSGDIPWWSGDTVNRPSAASLISAAKALEDQAQSLRDLASQHNASILDQNRRSTIALPVTQDPAYPAIDVPSNTVGPLDDMALLFAARSPSASGLRRQSDFSWYGGHTDNYASFSNYQLPALQSQAPHPENATHVGYTNTIWNLASRGSNQASGGDFLVTAQEQLVEQRPPFGRM